MNGTTEFNEIWLTTQSEMSHTPTRISLLGVEIYWHIKTEIQKNTLHKEILEYIMTIFCNVKTSTNVTKISY